MNQCRILCIDDEEKILQSYQTIFQPMRDQHADELEDMANDLFSDQVQDFQSSPPPNQFEVFVANQGVQGVERVQASKEEGNPFSIVFIDMRMPPGMDGLETAQKILEIDPEVEIVFVTAYSDRSIVEMADTLGQNRFLLLRKPFDPEELIQLAQFLTFRWKLSKLSNAYERFVPKEFLELLNKKSITDVRMGDHIRKNMSILFCDIRSFTNLSETLTPEENFEFLNSYLSRMGPIIRDHKGVVDKYIGDAIMALFDTPPDNAIDAAIAMLQNLETYNEGRGRAGYVPIQIGIGINTGEVMLGTIGEKTRMEGSVVSDAVNLASRIEGLTKFYGAPLLVSESSFAVLKCPERYQVRAIDRTVVKGKTAPTILYEVFNMDSPEIQEKKRQTQSFFEEAVLCFREEKWEKASEEFERILQINPQDEVAQRYRERSLKNLEIGKSKPVVS